MAVSQNYFQLFGLEEQYDLDLKRLADAYREIQRNTHPDRHAHGSRRDQLLSMQYTATVNDAYETLKSPLKRAMYLLKLSGIDLADDSSTHMDSEFLMQQIELREKLEAAQHAKDPESELEQIAEELEIQLSSYQEQFKMNLFDSSQSSLDKAAEQVKKMQFVVKMQHEVERLEEQLLDY